MSRIALPLDLDDPASLPETLVTAFAGTEVLLLGWYPGTHPATDSERGRLGLARLHEQAAALLRAGADVTVDTVEAEAETDLHDAVVNRFEADAVYVPGPISTFGRLLVPLRDRRTADNIVDLLSTMRLDDVVHMTLLHVAGEDTDREAVETMFEDVADRLAEAGAPTASVDVSVVEGDDPAYTIATEATAYDAVVMGETGQETVEASVFGPVYERVHDEADVPVVLVLRSDDADSD